MTLRADGAGGIRRRRPGVVLALLAMAWFAVTEELAARAATGFAGQVLAGALVPLLRAVFLLFLVGLGLALLDGRMSSPAAAVAGLPRRTSAGQEWARGAALGWGAAVLAVLPLVFSRRLLLSFWLEPRGWLAALVLIVGAGLTTLAAELVFRGYALPRVRESLGGTWAVVLVGLVGALGAGLRMGSARVAVLAFLFSVLLSVGWLRTHAIWLSWGLHFAWNVSLGMLFGLPVFDGGDLASMVLGQVRGRSVWLGGGLGPINGWWTAVVLLLAWGVLVAVTREFAWSYTHQPIVAAGYPMDVKPPAAHTALEQAPAAPPPLVQILPATPGSGAPPSPPPRVLQPPTVE